MHVFSKPIFIAGLLFYFTFAQTASAQSIKDIQEYCQSMYGSGIVDEDSKAFINDCIAEQSSYLEQDVPSEQYQESNHYEDSYQEPQYEQEDYGQEQNCYAKVDENIQKLLDTDPNAAFDYDQLIDKCLKGNL